jgi:hypothetical protein
MYMPDTFPKEESDFFPKYYLQVDHYDGEGLRSLWGKNFEIQTILELYNPHPSNVYTFIIVLSEGLADEHWKPCKAVMFILSLLKNSVSPNCSVFPFHLIVYCILHLSFAYEMPKPRQKCKSSVVVKKSHI